MIHVCIIKKTLVCIYDEHASLCECIKCTDTEISVHVFFVNKCVNEYASVYEKGVDYMRLC